MAKNPLPTPEELRQLLSYDPGTGALTWLPRPVSMFASGTAGPDKICAAWNKRYAGKEAGTINTSPRYRVIGMGRLIAAHRIAWAIQHGKWPEGYIDHINGDPLDNRIVNLRDVSNQENQRNCRLSTANKTGVTGVVPSTNGRKWMAKIRVNGRKHHLGTFSTIEEAAAARAQANKRFGFSERHGL